MDFAEAARLCNATGAHATTFEAVRLGLQAAPDDPMLYIYRACAHDEFGHSAEAIADCEAALAIAPAGTPAVLALITLALVRERIGDTAGALDAARAAIACDPADREAHAALGTLLAWHGVYPAAWPELECHWIPERVSFMHRFPGIAEWNGEDIAGKRLLLVNGQGLGDMLQMLRYVPRLHARGATVLLEVPDTLRELASSLSGVDAFITKGSALAGSFDIFARMMSLARLCGEDGSAGTSGAPYLRANSVRVATWNERLGARDGRMRTGLVWAGSPDHPNDRRRSIPLAALAPLASVPNVRWISLQTGPRASDPAPAGLILERYDDALATVADTAASIAQLDVVITIDTSVAHLAGALGAPVWVALPWRPDWRWMTGAEQTPWYPTMRLFQASSPAWDGPVAAIAAALTQHHAR